MDPRGYHQKSTRETVHVFDSLCHFRSAVYGKAESSQSWWGRMLFSPVRVFVPFSIDVFSRVAFEKVNSIRFVRSGRWFSWWFVSSFLLGGGVENRNKKKRQFPSSTHLSRFLTPKLGERCCQRWKLPSLMSFLLEKVEGFDKYQFIKKGKVDHIQKFPYLNTQPRKMYSEWLGLWNFLIPFPSTFSGKQRKRRRGLFPYSPKSSAGEEAVNSPRVSPFFFFVLYLFFFTLIPLRFFSVGNRARPPAIN